MRMETMMAHPHKSLPSPRHQTADPARGRRRLSPGARRLAMRALAHAGRLPHPPARPLISLYDRIGRHSTGRCRGSCQSRDVAPRAAHRPVHDCCACLCTAVESRTVRRNHAHGARLRRNLKPVLFCYFPLVLTFDHRTAVHAAPGGDAGRQTQSRRPAPRAV